MSVHSLQPPASTAAENVLVQALRQAGLCEHDLIHVAGPGALPAMLWLCRRGFERAQSICLHSPSCGAEAADALLIPHLSLVEDLPRLLQGAPAVREGGVLIVRAGARCGPAGIFASLAQPFGFDLEQHVVDKGHALYVARRLPRAKALKVA